MMAASARTTAPIFASSNNNNEDNKKQQTTAAVAAHRIPYLQLHLTVVDVDHPRPELYANCEIVHRLKTLVGELQKQT